MHFGPLLFLTSRLLFHEFLSPFFFLSQSTSYIWVCPRILPSAYLSQNVVLNLILVISNISTSLLTNPQSISLGLIISRETTCFQLSTGRIFPDVPQITPLQHVQNITSIFIQVKLFLYKPTHLSVFLFQVMKTSIPLSVQARTWGDILVIFISLTQHSETILRPFPHHLVIILLIYFLISVLLLPFYIKSLFLHWTIAIVSKWIFLTLKISLHLMCYRIIF